MEHAIRQRFGDDAAHLAEAWTWIYRRLFPVAVDGPGMPHQSYPTSLKESTQVNNMAQAIVGGFERAVATHPHREDSSAIPVEL
jgi:hypothetical protein